VTISDAIDQPFSPIARRSLADGVREQLATSIRTGTFSAGALLPSEQSLSLQFRVSRTSVREAIRELIVLGLLERRGNRAYVVEHLPAVRVDSQAARAREVFETRRLLEVQLAEYAAARATPGERADIVAVAAEIRRAETIEALRPLDRAFHSLIASAAGNALLAELHTKVLDAVFEPERFAAILHDADDERESAAILAETSRAHTAIAVAIAAGDVAAAGAAARAHLDEVAARMY
jgi:GntR family transcriptional repressor for pyruvate dehydrogenase complex